MDARGGLRRTTAFMGSSGTSSEKICIKNKNSTTRRGVPFVFSASSSLPLIPSPRNDGLARALVDETQDERRADDPRAARHEPPPQREDAALVHERGGGCAVPQAPQPRGARPPAGAARRTWKTRRRPRGWTRLDRITVFTVSRGCVSTAAPSPEATAHAASGSGRASRSVGTARGTRSCKASRATVSRAPRAKARSLLAFARRSVFVSRCSLSA